MATMTAALMKPADNRANKLALVLAFSMGSSVMVLNGRKPYYHTLDLQIRSLETSI